MTGMFSERFYSVWTCVWLFRWNFLSPKAVATKTVGTPHTRRHLHQLQTHCFCLFQSIADLRCCNWNCFKVKSCSFHCFTFTSRSNPWSLLLFANIRKCRTMLKCTSFLFSERKNKSRGVTHQLECWWRWQKGGPQVVRSKKYNFILLSVNQKQKQTKKIKLIKELHRKCLKSKEYRESSGQPLYYSLLCLI